MKVNQAELVISAAKQDQFPGTMIPEVALSGRSNVGKSSFINTLINRKGLARTSQRPGKTQTLNFYIINDRFHFVDVPGYGYAKVSKAERAAWGKTLELYFSSREQLNGVVQLIDSRHKPSEDDILMYDWLKHHGHKVVLIATKCDKIPRGKWAKSKKQISGDLNRDPSDPLIMFSSETGQGKEEAWREIKDLLFAKQPDQESADRSEPDAND
ncbi:ribosome biogenesis GTP-binding protein YihA/YsxC [Salisediminibacterium selenitireducens]|uniref:Probable GTP-binding protein EngB n=1 Tax=Bacillus selenitireducens (strain ATCC 700615 / DSM 15326 / MLS10) TaxID=439292 RepID=D6XSZ4_BACIE|nr:ribosome biogenesis GTP-binding protein YihA/YsxC [Salisediminibacterium selenitireducens]ADH98930.1 ribosome biogenesis GTP-binding protein YsxC [[Bacillus] selenitireducens MLS10]